MEKVEQFVRVYGNGSGYGCSYGSGIGSGNGSGDGYGSGIDYGGSIDYGCGHGNGNDYGIGDGYGSGYGSSYGSSYGIYNDTPYGYIYNGRTVYNIDKVPTIINSVCGNYAKGAIVSNDMQLIPCYVVKQGNIFAHGKTLRKAQEALNDKLFENLPAEERVESFTHEFKPQTEYPTRLFWEWHNKLTGSCEMGRNQFAKEHKIDLNGKMTVEMFIRLTENAYGGDIIQMLKPFYCMEDKL